MSKSNHARAAHDDVKFANAAAMNVALSEVSLAGGYAPGHVIYSKINWKGEQDDTRRRVKVGEKGRVLGPATICDRDLLVQRNQLLLECLQGQLALAIEFAE